MVVFHHSCFFEWELEWAWIPLLGLPGSLALPLLCRPQFTEAIQVSLMGLLWRITDLLGWFLKCDPPTSSISALWELVRKTSSQTPPQTHWIRNSGDGAPVISVFTSLPDDSEAGLNLEIIDLMYIEALRTLAHTSLSVSEVQVRYQAGPVS